MEKIINYINDKFSDYLDWCKKMNKRGLAVSTIIVIIIVIVGLGILLYFYSQVAWTGNIDRAVCHQSVVYRGTIPEVLGAKDIVPLRCRTEKVCITSSFFGKCDEFEGTKGIKTLFPSFLTFSIPVTKTFSYFKLTRSTLPSLPLYFPLKIFTLSPVLT